MSFLGVFQFFGFYVIQNKMIPYFYPLYVCFLATYTSSFLSQANDEVVRIHRLGPTVPMR